MSTTYIHKRKLYSRLHSLVVAGHVHVQVIWIVQHLRSKQIVLQVTPRLSELEQLTLIAYCPAKRGKTKLMASMVLHVKNEAVANKILLYLVP